MSDPTPTERDRLVVRALFGDYQTANEAVTQMHESEAEERAFARRLFTPASADTQES